MNNLPVAFRIVKPSGKTIFLDYEESKSYVEYSFPLRPKNLPISVGILCELYLTNNVVALYEQNNS